MKKYIKARLKEPSTWRGLCLILTACGVAVSPQQMEAIMFVGLLIAGGLGAAVPDNGVVK